MSGRRGEMFASGTIIGNTVSQANSHGERQWHRTDRNVTRSDVMQNGRFKVFAKVFVGGVLSSPMARTMINIQPPREHECPGGTRSRASAVAASVKGARSKSSRNRVGSRPAALPRVVRRHGAFGRR